MHKIVLILPLALAMMFGSASAKWLEITSDNFIFVGDVKEEDARKLISDLEIYRATILALTNVEARNEVRPVRIYGARSTSKVKDLTGISNVSGVYTTSDDGPVFIMEMANGVDPGDWSRNVALHEYAHHVINSFLEDYIPLWYNEGFAEYLASFVYEDGIVTLGLPASRFGETLSEEAWIDEKQVFSAVTSYPDFKGAAYLQSVRMQLFYGMSWLAVHYIQNHPEVSAGFPDYIARINAGEDPTEAFEQGFGMTQKEFEDLLQSYWRADQFPIVRFTYDSAPLVNSLEAREISDIEADKASIAARTVFARGGDSRESFRRKLRSDIEKLEKKIPGDLVLMHAKKHLALVEGDHDRSVEIGESAVASAPGDPAALLILADAYFHRYFAEKKLSERDPENLRKAREYFGQVLQPDMDPTNPTANTHYVSSFAHERAEPDDLALQAVEFVSRYHRNLRALDTHLEIAQVLLLAGREQEACSRLQKIAPLVRRRAEERGDKGDDPESTEDEGEDASDADLPETAIEALDRMLTELGDTCPAG